VLVRSSAICVAVFCICLIFASAQTAQVSTNPNYAVSPNVTFSLEFPSGDPPHYSITVSSDGRATYESDPGSEQQTGEPYTYRFTISAADRDKIFNGAKQLKYFNEDFESRKGKVAFTGNKTLAYKDADRNFRSSYNWSNNQAVQELTALFEGIAETMEFGRRLTYYHAHDKLGLDSELKQMEQMSKDHQLAEIQALAPILKSIADDNSVLNISRRRAAAMLMEYPPAG